MKPLESLTPIEARVALFIHNHKNVTWTRVAKECGCTVDEAIIAMNRSIIKGWGFWSGSDFKLTRPIEEDYEDD